MSGNIKTIIVKINKNCDDLDFSSARKLIEMNLSRLSETINYMLLNANAKTLVKHVIEEKSHDNNNTLTHIQLLQINNINNYCTTFDISMLKRTLRDSTELIQRPDVLPLLNKDARMILESMGEILGIPPLQVTRTSNNKTE